MLDNKREGDDQWVLPSERIKLIRLCATLAGRSDVAEDLAQETLVEAWRSRHRLRTDVEQSAWLSGIARRVCLRWRRRIWQEQVHLRPVPMTVDPHEDEFSAPQEVDFEGALSRTELIDLLDRALALLPPDTQTLLVQQYMNEMPRSEIAARLGIAEGAVAVRLHRGKIALRRIFERELRDEAAAYGLLPSRLGTSQRQTTHFWCPLCGHHRLVGHFDPNTGSLALGCPRCSASRDYIQAHGSRLLAGVKGCRPALKRLLAWSHHYFSAAARARNTRCHHCGGEVPVRRIKISCLASWSGPAVHVRCPSCQATCTGAISLAFCSEVLGFWERHPRMHISDQRLIAASGRPALLTRFESVTEAARIEVVQAADTLELLQVARS